MTGKKYVYVLADGIHAKVRLEGDANKKLYILVLMGATADGKKELIAVLDGYRESEQNWPDWIDGAIGHEYSRFHRTMQVAACICLYVVSNAKQLGYA